MISLIWSEEAKDDLQRLYKFLEQFSTVNANKALDLLLAETNNLKDYPEIGRIWDKNPHMRNWPFKFGSKGYVMRYRLTDDAIIILRVWHSREDR